MDHFRDSPEDEIRVWVIPIEASVRVANVLETVLSPVEQAEASRMSTAALRRRSVFSRGVLRVMLSRYLPLKAHEIELSRGSRGKPALASPDRLRFNVSHSGDRILLAFARECEIGVDVEHIRDLADFEAIAHRFFAPGESADLGEMPVGARAEAFFRCWTRKEAYLKAIGDGLWAPHDGCVSNCFVANAGVTAALRAALSFALPDRVGERIVETP